MSSSSGISPSVSIDLDFQALPHLERRAALVGEGAAKECAKGVDWDADTLLDDNQWLDSVDLANEIIGAVEHGDVLYRKDGERGLYYQAEIEYAHGLLPTTCTVSHRDRHNVLAHVVLTAGRPTAFHGRPGGLLSALFAHALSASLDRFVSEYSRA